MSLPLSARRLAYSSIFVRMQFTQRGEGTAKTKPNRRIRKTLSTVSDQKKCINIFVFSSLSSFGLDRAGRGLEEGQQQEQSPPAASSFSFTFSSSSLLPASQLQIFGNSAKNEEWRRGYCWWLGEKRQEESSSQWGTYDRTDGIPTPDLFHRI